MELTHTFTVPVPPEQAFRVLQDIERIGPCMPGATIDSVDGRSFTGRVKVKIGPIQVTYNGEASYTDVDADALTATIDARGKEARGSGTANATVTSRLTAVPDGTEVHVVTDLAITGRPAQFGRGVMEEIGQKLINQFADCLSDTLGDESDTGPSETPAAGAPSGPATGEVPPPPTPSGNGSSAPARDSEVTPPPAAASSSVRPPSTPTSTPSRQRSAGEGEAIDLLDVAGASVAKRAAPVLAGVLLLLVLRWLRRRRS